MLRYIAVGVLLALLLCIVFAPASLLGHAVKEIPGLEVVAPRGTLWSGHGGVVIQGEQIGIARWTLHPLRLLLFELAYSVRFTGRDAVLDGAVTVTPGTVHGRASGTLGADALNYTLAPWDVRIEQPVAVETVEAVFENRRLAAIDGQLAWPGGATTWLLDGSPTTVALPPMTGRLAASEGRLTGLLVPADGQIPLVQMMLAPDGTFTLKISKLLTRLVGRPWPGSDPDPAIVIEMVDDLF